MSGRNPCRSRKATSLPSAIAVTVNAPSSLAIAFATACASGASSFAIRAAMTSVSDVERRVTPISASSARISSALVRFPLWPSATVRERPWTTIGCAFTQCVDPVVE